jgi:septal ring factor EnvC (AmiA/AmiB activator)
MKKNPCLLKSLDVTRGWSHSFCFILLFLPATLFAQESRKDLESKRNALIEQISYTTKLLERSQRTKTATLEDYNLLRQQMKTREKLLDNLKAELAKLDEELTIFKDSITIVGQEIEEQQNLIRKISQEQFLWKNSISEWAFVLSASSWRTALMRWNILSQLRSRTKQQMDIYQEIQSRMELLVEQRELLREDQAVLMQDAAQNVKTLASEAKSKQRSLSALEQKEKQLRRDLERKKKERLALNKAIEDLIIEELRAAKEEKSSLAEAPALARLSRSFEQNKGKLPWPLNRGVVIGHFGQHPHPTLKQVTIVNNGIDFRTEPGEKAKALFNGKVVGIKYIPGYEQMVIIQHGEYYTVYSKLSDVVVKKGQQVTTGQVLGPVWQNQNNGIFELHLEIWNGKKQLDPEAWIASR